MVIAAALSEFLFEEGKGRGWEVTGGERYKLSWSQGASTRSTSTPFNYLRSFVLFKD
jgi:hypothetical protein